MTDLEKLKEKLITIDDLYSASALLTWDNETYMPREGGPARARQMATLERMAHELFTSSEIGDLLSALIENLDDFSEDSDDKALIQRTKRNYEKQKRIPARLQSEIIEHGTNTYQVWLNAREENNYSIIASSLEKTVSLSQEYASFYEEKVHIADPLIDDSDPGMRALDIQAVFGELREKLVPIVQAIRDQPTPDDSILRKYFSESKQSKFGLGVIEKLGLDLNRCRLDTTMHPFMTKFSFGDLRITTRYKESDFSDGFFSILHEAGHALYEMGIKPSFEASPLGVGISAGVHESQSRLWENMIGRSRDFWKYFYPGLKQFFPQPFSGISLDQFYRAINKVEPSLIRTEADEVTYNLHVMIRFDLELALLEGDLAIKDLPGAWNDRYKSDLGVVPSNDSEGVLQDVHWYSGLVGGSFQGYTLGNIMSAQFYDAALAAHPEFEAEIRIGRFDTILGWLRENIYQHGSKYMPDELLARVTGNALDTKPLINYLNRKFGDLYQLH